MNDLVLKDIKMKIQIQEPNTTRTKLTTFHNWGTPLGSLVDVGSYRFYILAIFSIMHSHSLRRFSGPPCHYRYIYIYIYIYSGKRLPDAEGFVIRVPFGESREGESPRGGDMVIPG